MSIKVVDLQTEAVQEEPPAIEEANEEGAPEPVSEVVEEHEVLCSMREPTEKPKEEVKEIVKEEEEEAKPKPKPVRAQDKIVTCPKCNKSMKTKSYRYTHQQNCQGQLSEKPVKPHAKPRVKQQPKPKPKHEVLSGQRNPPPEIYYSDDDEEEQTTHKPLSKPVKNQILKPQPINPQTALAQHYQLLQQAFIKQKQEKMNNLCQNMFSSKTKKR